MCMRSAILIFCFFVASPVVVAEDVGDWQKADTNNLSSYKQLHKLASKGSAAAQYELGLLFEYGRGVAQDDATAAFWYEKAAAQFFTNAQYRLAILYDNGWGLKSDKVKALGLYKTAAEKGHHLAQHDLAIMYFQGSDTPRSLLEAYKWLKIATMSGNPLMQKHLSMVASEMSSDEIQIAAFLAKKWLEDSGI